MIPTKKLQAFVFSNLGFATRGQAACSRAALQDITAAYLSAVTAGQSNAISSLAVTNATYFENDAPVEITKGVLAQPIKVDYNLSIYDTTQCSTFTTLTAASNPHPYVIHTHIYLDGDTPEPLKIKSIESVVTDEGDWIFNATGHLYWSLREDWSPIPLDSPLRENNTRETIKASADAYLDQWGNPSHPVPFATPCARLEGGVYTGQRDNFTTNTCPMGAFPTPLNVTNRRYVIDEELGAVDIFNDFPWLDSYLREQNKSAPSTNLFRVERGLIKYIHELTVCAKPSCRAS